MVFFNARKNNGRPWMSSKQAEHLFLIYLDIT